MSDPAQQVYQFTFRFPLSAALEIGNRGGFSGVNASTDADAMVIDNASSHDDDAMDIDNASNVLEDSGLGVLGRGSGEGVWDGSMISDPDAMDVDVEMRWAGRAEAFLANVADYRAGEFAEQVPSTPLLPAGLDANGRPLRTQVDYIHFLVQEAEWIKSEICRCRRLAKVLEIRRRLARHMELEPFVGGDVLDDALRELLAATDALYGV